MASISPWCLPPTQLGHREPAGLIASQRWESLAPKPLQGPHRKGWGPDGGTRSILCPFLLSAPIGASTLWLLATPMGLLFVLRGGPQSTFPVVPRGKRAGWFFPSCRTMAILTDA